MKYPPKFTDLLGQEVRVGDVVAYSVRVGNVAETKVAVVEYLNWREKMDGGYWEWKVRAFAMSSYGGTYRFDDAKPSSPSRARMVRVEKGSNW